MTTRAFDLCHACATQGPAAGLSSHVVDLRFLLYTTHYVIHIHYAISLHTNCSSMSRVPVCGAAFNVPMEVECLSKS
jgi:hypothetical protein